jgi:hypothetical protein
MRSHAKSIDGVEHRATLEGVMVGQPAGGQNRRQIMVRAPEV